MLKIENNVLISADEDIKVAIIPDGVTSIGDGVFYGCASLKKIKIPDSVTSIGNGAFYGCTSLKEIKMPDGVTSIGTLAFGGCTSFKKIIMPNSVTSIGMWAFGGCGLNLHYKNNTYKLLNVDGISTILGKPTKIPNTNIIVYRANIFEGVKDGELILEKCYVAKEDDFFAHGKTVSEAIIDLKFKMAVDNTDNTKYLEQDRDMKMELTEAMVTYHVITGSCRLGIDDFVEKMGISKNDMFSINDILKLTKEKEAYGYEVFERYFKE